MQKILESKHAGYKVNMFPDKSNIGHWPTDLGRQDWFFSVFSDFAM